MTLAEKVEEIVNNLYPDANFLLASQFEADYQSYFEDNNTYIVLNNMLEDDDSIQLNVNITTQTRIQITVYIKDEFDTLGKDSNGLSEQAKAVSRAIYQNLWLSSEVNGQLSDGKITHKPVIKDLNSIRTGVLSLARWQTSFVISCVPEDKYKLTLSSSDESQGLVVANPNRTVFSDGEQVTIAAAALTGFEFDYWDINGGEFTNSSEVLTMDEEKAAVAYFIISGGFGDYYQWLPLGLDDDLVNKGTGLSAVDGFLISGSMATQDIEFDWVRGDAGLQAVADAYGVINPMTYDGLVDLPAFPRTKINASNSVLDYDVSLALKADNKLLDVVMIGDSNQLLGGNGWDLSIDKVLTDKYGMYGTALISANENNGNGANQGYEYSRLNGGLIGTIDGQPEPFASMWKGISYNLPSYLDTGETIPPVKNNALIILRDCPIGVNNELTFRINYANFSSGGGTIYPRVRLEESPYSNQTPIETVNCSGADEMTCYDLVMPAAIRDKHISYKFAYAETLNGKLFIPFTHAFRTGATSGIAAHSLIAQGGASLEQMIELLLDSTLEQTSYYFYAIRERQMDLGQVVPNIVVRINSGLNDRNQIDSSKATYKARLQSIIDRIIAVWNYKGWELNELSFIITPSHRISDPDDAKLIGYREAAREICLTQPKCAMADFGELMTYQEALDNGWYLNGNDTSHLDVLGSETCATRELDLLTKQWIPESALRVTEKDGVFTDWAVLKQ